MARAYLIIEALEAERRRNLRTVSSRRQRLRDEAQISMLSDMEFRLHYRFTKEIFLGLCSELAPYMSPKQRATKTSVQCKVLTALSFFATGSYQKPVGMSYLHALSQPSVSKVIKEVTDALTHPAITSKYIKFPQNQAERNQIINGFYDKFGFMGCLGCIDCTHVALVRPSEHEERFFNRKHYHSRNVQLICDSDLNILNVDPSFGGATHDAHIWRTSEIQAHLMQLHQSGERLWLLGDSGYPLRPWLLTPIINAQPNSAEQHYTNIHCRTRNTIERCIGVLKSRWRCLLSHRVLHYDHHMVAKIINACVVLHNIANRHRLPVAELSPEEASREQNLQIMQHYNDGHDEQQALEDGRRQRELIVRRLWHSR